VNNFNT